jgi:hypothetical protein
VKIFLAAIIAAAAVVAPAWATPHVAIRSPAAADPVRLAPGSIPERTGSFAREPGARDILESGTHGKARFPEWAPEAQSLGGTANRTAVLMLRPASSGTRHPRDEEYCNRNFQSSELTF